MRTLTPNQQWVLDELRRRDHDFIASATELHWRAGESYYTDSRVGKVRGIRRRFNQGNKEATRWLPY